MSASRAAAGRTRPLIVVSTSEVRTPPTPMRLSGGPDILPETAGDRIDRRQLLAADHPTHPVSVLRDTKLASVVGSGGLQVNSFHRQAVARLSAGPAPAAWAEDGTHSKLFRAFIAACRGADVMPLPLRSAL